MSKEKKAIEVLNALNKIEKESEIIPTAYNSCVKRIFLTLIPEDFGIFERLLNLIEKQQKELQLKDNIINTSIMPSYEETILEHEKRLFEMQEELQLKDKVIDCLAQYIAGEENEQQRIVLNRLKDELIGDRMEQFDDYVIYLQTKYLKILGEEDDE